MATGSELIGSFSRATVDKFEERRTVLSFHQYLEEIEKNPGRHLRGAPKYFLDMFMHFGGYELQQATGAVYRWTLFDAPFDGGEGQVLGQERMQNAIFRNIQNFVKAGRCDRLVLLHGPNGSAKTSMLRMIARGAEVFSEKDEGALYRFNWVFPLKSAMKGNFGFSQNDSVESVTFAHLTEEQIESKILCENNDHPILLLDAGFRKNWMHQLLERGLLPRDYPVGEFFKRGDLSSKNKKIFQALMTTYRGDISQVLRHVQVERFYLSQRYRVGLASVEPQMSVDAYARQLTMDQSLSALPSSLRHLSLYETGGALTEGNRGMIEYNDLLKRPIEAWKYLLVATELGQASVDNVTLFFDSLMLGSSNELHLQSFREYPDWQSFKGRFELVRVPYLLRFSDELKIYQTQIPKSLNGIHVAPHALEVAARWAVLTRLEAPKGERYSEVNRDLVMSLSPEEKLELYDTGATPQRLTQSESRELKRLIEVIHKEYEDDRDYEGKFGASAREMRTLILSASQSPNSDHLSPVAILEGIENLVREKSSYEFLRRESVRGYNDPENFIGVVRKKYLQDFAESLCTSMGLIDADSHKDLLERYIRNISAWTKKEKLYHPLTQKMVDPDLDLMSLVERIVMARGESVEEFRRSLISQIGAQVLDEPEQVVDYSQLFSGYLKKLKDDYFTRQIKTIEHAQEVFMQLLQEGANKLEPGDRALALTLQKNLYALGYNDSSAKSAMSYLLQNRI